MKLSSSPLWKSLCGLALCSQLANLAQAQIQEYDYIVVGAGSAGSIVAGELARYGAYVLLVDEGSDNTDPAIPTLKQYFNVAFNTYNYGWLQYPYTTVDQTMDAAPGEATPRSISIPRGKVLGGTHSINAAAYVVGSSDDFDSIADTLDDSSWKWSRTAWLRRQMEKRLGILELGAEQVGAPEFIAVANDILGFPYNSDGLDGEQFGVCPSYWTAHETPSGGRRRTSYEAFVTPLFDDQFGTWNGDIDLNFDYFDEDNEEGETPRRFKGDGFIDVMTHHRAESLIFDDEDPTKVVGIRCYNTRANVEATFTAKNDVILSAGTYNSPQILMLSGVGPSDHLTDLGIDVVLDLPGVGENLRDHYAVSTFWGLADLEEDSPLLFQSPTLNMFGPETSGPTSYQIELSGTFGSCQPLRQQSVGNVKLQSSDPTDYPLIDPKVLSVESDLDDLMDCMQNYLLPFFTELISEDLLTAGNIDPAISEADLRQFILDNIGSNHHPAGTCKLGVASDNMAVVDNNFKVHGISNLRVVDASVFPLVPSSNINAATMTAAMLATRKIMQEHWSGVSI